MSFQCQSRGEGCATLPDHRSGWRVARRDHNFDLSTRRLTVTANAGADVPITVEN